MVLASNNQQVNFTQTFESHIASYDSPNRIFKSTQGQMWLLFDRHLSIVADGFHKQVQYKSISTKTNADFKPAIAENSHGVYFSIGDEVFHYSSDNDIFTRINLDLKQQDQIVAILKDSKGNIWIASFLTLSKVTQTPDVESIVFPERFIDVEVGSPLLYSAQFSPSDTLFLGTYSFGLLKYDEKAGFSLVDERFKNENMINVMRFAQNELIFGTVSGVFGLQLDDKALTRLFETKVKQPVVSLAVDKDDNFYFASKRRLWKSNQDKNELLEITLPANKNSGDKANIKTLYIDDEGIIWLSIKDQGLFSYHPLRHKLHQVDLKIAQLRNTQTAIINGDFDFLISDKESTYLSSIHQSIKHPVYSYLKSGNDVYLGSTGYIIHMNQQQNLQLIDYAKGSIYPDEKILVMSTDSDNRIWVVAEKSGLNVFQLESSLFSPAIRRVDISQQLKVKVRYVQSADQNTMILTTSDSIYRYDTDTAKLTLLESIKHPIVQFKTLGEELLLISDDDVAFTYHLVKQQLQKFDFGVNNIGCAIKHQGHWLVAQKNGRLYQYKAGELRFFDVVDGLGVGGLNGKACFSLKNTTYFAGFDGLYTLNDDNQSHNDVKPITSIHSIVVKDNTQLMSALTRPELTINDSDFPVRFNLSSSSFINMDKNQYQYRFKNKGNQWRNFTQDNRQISFSALSANNYLIEFRASNNHGVWSEPIGFKLIVKPPFWLSFSAKLFYLLMVFLLGYGFYARRLKLAKETAAKLQQLVAQRTHEVNVEKQHIEQLLSQKQQELIQVSHELRTPIALISGPLDQVMKSSQSQTDKSNLEMALRNTQRLAGIVDQLIDLDRFRLQKSQQMTSHNATKIIEFIVDSFAPSAQSKAIALVLQKNPSCYLHCVPDALEKILMNLLSNAIKYTDNNGTIELTPERLNDGSYQITVKDTGKGIAPEHLPHLFNTFYRVNDQQTQSQPGAGVGLALVKELIEFHGGTIEVSSEIGIGSEFTLLFPAKAVCEAPTEDSHVNTESLQSQIDELAFSYDFEPNESAKTPSESTKTTILIIEDNLDMQQYLTNVLSQTYQCLVAINGSEGVNAALQHMPDLIITDVMMPIMSGFEATQLLKEDARTSHIPIIILTARGDRDSKMQGWRALADEYLAKPFDSDELLIRIENLLTIRALISHRLARDISENSVVLNHNEPSISVKDQEFIERFNDNLQQKYTDPDFTIDDIADSVFMSKRQLQRKIKALFDYTPSEYLRIYRLKKAHSMIVAGAKITEVSQDTGFSSHSYFGRCFKAHFGCTPSELQSQNEAVL